MIPANAAQQLVDGIKALIDENTLLKAQIAAGTTARPNNRKKLGKREADTIRNLHRIGATNKEIADVYDVHPVTISRIVRGQYYK